VIEIPLTAQGKDHECPIIAALDSTGDPMIWSGAIPTNDEPYARAMAVAAYTSAMVGRATERGVLNRLLAAAAGGSGATVLVEGEAGIGKTRLVQTGRGRAQAWYPHICRCCSTV